jgi:hypothetical protein
MPVVVLIVTVSLPLFRNVCEEAGGKDRPRGCTGSAGSTNTRRSSDGGCRRSEGHSRCRQQITRCHRRCANSFQQSTILSLVAVLPGVEKLREETQQVVNDMGDQKRSLFVSAT